MTAAEDGAVRLWNAHSGQCVALIRCHAGHGAWCCVAVGSHLLVTGGGDCALKLWKLPEWLPVHTAHLLTRPLSVSELQLYDPEQQQVQTKQPDVITSTRESIQTSTTQLIVSLPNPSEEFSQHEEECVSGSSSSAAALPVTHDSTSEGVCALALSACDTLYVATSLGRIMRVDLLLTQHCDVEDNADSQAVWSSVCVAPQEHMALSCCAAQRYSACMPCFVSHKNPKPSQLHNSTSLTAQGCVDESSVVEEGRVTGSVDVVVCGSRMRGLTVACVAAGCDTQPSVWQISHFRLSKLTQAPILAVWIPKVLPPGHVLCTDSDNNVWWVFVSLSATRDGETEPEEDMMVLATCTCGPKTRVASVEVLPDCGLLAVGDSLGGVAAYSFPPALQTAATMADAQSVRKEAHCSGCGDAGEERGAQVAPLQLACVSTFRKVHATTPVTLAKAVGSTLYTGGRNGAIFICFDCCIWQCFRTCCALQTVLSQESLSCFGQALYSFKVLPTNKQVVEPAAHNKMFCMKIT